MTTEEVKLLHDGMGGRTTLMGTAQILLSFSEDSRVSLRDPAVGKHILQVEFGALA